MASSITNTATNVASNANTTAVNPKGQLQSQDFMKLLLTELQYQDPTSPMDTEKMLTQTSQLATLESQNATKDAMTAMTKSFAQSASYALAGSIGKMANTGQDALSIQKGASGKFDVYLPTDVINATVSIMDGNKNVVKTFSMLDKTKGTYTLDWDAKDSGGNALADGTYTADISYQDTNGVTGKSALGAYPIQSIKFAQDGSEPQLKVGNSYMALSKIKEIY